MSIKRALFIVATAFCATAGAAASASPDAGADPNWYSTLSCNCQNVPKAGLAAADQVKAGIEDGLAQLQGVAG